MALRFPGAGDVFAQIGANAFTSGTCRVDNVGILDSTLDPVLKMFCRTIALGAIQSFETRSSWTFNIQAQRNSGASTFKAKVTTGLLILVIARGAIWLFVVVRATFTIIVVACWRLVTLALRLATIDASAQPITNAFTSRTHIVFRFVIIVVAFFPVLCVRVRALTTETFSLDVALI
jgi:hypothetical protein